MSNIDAEVEKEKIETKVAENEKTDDNSTKSQVISISSQSIRQKFIYRQSPIFFNTNQKQLEVIYMQIWYFFYHS